MSDRGPLRFSHLRALGTRSPAHFAAGIEPEETASMEKGTATHALLFKTRPVVGYYEGKNRSGKEFAAFKADQAPDTEILTFDAHAQAKAMADAVRANVVAMRALEGVNERRLIWQFAGVDCQSTPDAYQPKRLSELKTTRSARPFDFQRQALNSHWHGQMGFYDEALRTLKLSDPQEHIVVAVENTKPFIVCVFRFTDRAREAGMKTWRGWFERFKVCRDTGLWPAYSAAVVEIDAAPEMPDLIFADGESAQEA